MRSPASADCSTRFARLLALAALAAPVPAANAQAGLGSIRGLVHDSLRAGGPLAGAEVEVLELGRRVLTDAAGRFRIDSVPAGRFTVSFSHPDLVAFGFQPPERTVEIGSGIDVSLVLATPSPATILGRLCPGRREAETGVLLGRVTDPLTGRPAEGGEVRGQWTETVLATGGLTQRPRAVRSLIDGAGRYRLCGVPTDVPVVLSTGTAELGGVPLALDLKGQLVVVRDLALARTDSAAPRDARATGTVRNENGDPVAQALVSVLGLDRAVRTDSEGSFALSGLPSGSFTLDARAVGYARAHAGLELRPGATAQAAIVLSRLAVELPEVTVTAATPADPTGFTLRRTQRDGYFIGRDDIQRRGSVRTEDLFRAIPGIKLEPVGAADYQILSTRGGTGISTLCAPAVFIDGIPVPLDPRSGSSIPVLPEEIHGIEIYHNAGEAPPEFRSRGASCAIILVWTRRGGR